MMRYNPYHICTAIIDRDGRICYVPVAYMRLLKFLKALDVTYG